MRVIESTSVIRPKLVVSIPILLKVTCAFSLKIYIASFLEEIGKLVLGKDNRDTRPSYAKSWTYLSWFDIKDIVSFKTFP